MVFIFLVIVMLLDGPAAAQETSLIDILQAKGVLSKKEVQQLRKGAAAKAGGSDQQALISLLRKKGILGESDLAQLQAPSAVAAAPAPATPEVTQWLSHLESKQLETQARVEAVENKKFPFTAGYEDGFFVRSADGNFSLRVGGRVAMNTLYQQEDTTQNDSFTMDRVRLYTEGFLYKYYQYKVEAEFATSSSILRDAYLNVTYFPQANVQVGQYKIPFSYEELLSKRYTDLVERSAVTFSTVNPSRDIGLMVHGRVAGGLLNYQLAVLNGSGQNTADNNSAKDLVARFVLAPFVAQKASLLSGLNFGGAITYGHEPKSNSIFGTSPTGFQFFKSVPVRGDRMRVGGHLAWFSGPYSVTGEYIYTSEQRQKQGKNGADLSDFVTQGGYIGGTWLLSGEDKIFNKPNRPLLIFLDPTGKMAGWGSWELAARYETFRLDNEGGTGKPGALKSNTFEAARLGLNWYLNPWTRVSVEYIYSLYDDAKRSPRPGHHSVNSILSRVQLEF
jgi:phosphate-selective porin OprO and OprP